MKSLSHTLGFHFGSQNIGIALVRTETFATPLLRTLLSLAFVLTTTFSGTSWAWYDKTHLAIAKAAGYENWYNAAAADVSKIKAGSLEEKNHYFNNYDNANVTPEMVMNQVKMYNAPNDEEGHLYGAIIAALHDYRNSKLSGKYTEYYMAYAVHYISDLSQPLHNVLYDNFNKTHHSRNDGIVDDVVSDNISRIQNNMYEIRLRLNNFDGDLAREIARVANISRLLGLKMRAENRDMKKEEAYVQLGHSASLIKAVFKQLDRH